VIRAAIILPGAALSIVLLGTFAVPRTIMVARSLPPRDPPISQNTLPPILFAAAVAAGFLVCAYLLLLEYSGAVRCPTGEECDLVFSSIYATLLGVPLVLWGTSAYLILGVLYVAARAGVAWSAVLLLAFSGLFAAVSACLALIQLLVLESECAWCLTSGWLSVLATVSSAEMVEQGRCEVGTCIGAALRRMPGVVRPPS